MITLDISLTKILLKQTYPGGFNGMRYYLKAEGKDKFIAYVYPEPYCFEATSDDQKESTTYDLNEEGLSAAADWLNEKYSADIPRWSEAHKNW